MSQLIKQLVMWDKDNIKKTYPFGVDSDQVQINNTNLTETLSEIINQFTDAKKNSQIFLNQMPVNRISETSLIIQDGLNLPIQEVNLLGRTKPNYITTLDYIQSTGTQYIDTLINPKDNSIVKFETEIMVTNFQNTRQLMGLNVNPYFGINANGYYEAYTGSTAHYTENGYDKIEYIFSSNNEKKIFVNNELVLSDITSAGTSNGNIYLFKLNYTTPFYCNMRMKYFKIWLDDVLVRDFIPVLDNNNIACLFDKITNTLFHNQGTGIFIAGSSIDKIPNPNYELSIQNVTGDNIVIISDGNENIQTTVLPLNNLELAGMGTYRDRIFKNTPASKYCNYKLNMNSWYIQNNLKKFIFDGTESWTQHNKTNENYLCVYRNLSDMTTGIDLLSNYFVRQNSIGSKNCMYNSYQTNFIISINKSIASTVEEFQTWLSTHNVMLYYRATTPTYTLITDPVLIQALEELNKKFIYENNTYCSVSGENIDPIIEIAYIQKLASVLNN